MTARAEPPASACMPVRALWGERGAVGRNFDVLALWRAIADQVDGGPLPGAHYLAEEIPDEVLREAGAFLDGLEAGRRHRRVPSPSVRLAL